MTSWSTSARSVDSWKLLEENKQRRYGQCDRWKLYRRNDDSRYGQMIVSDF